MYKKKKVEISFEVVEWVDDESEYGSNVNEWLGHLKDLVNCLDYRAEYEVEGYGEYEEPIYRKLKSTGAKIEVTEAGFLTEDAINKDELWERYGDSGYYQFKAFDTLHPSGVMPQRINKDVRLRLTSWRSIASLHTLVRLSVDTKV